MTAFPRAVAHPAMVRTLGLEVVGPLVLFYGLRAAGASQWIALLAGGALSLANAVHGIVTQRRISGITLFVLGAMGLTVAISFVSGSPRALLVRNAWGGAALGLWMLLTLLGRRPFLYEGARILFDSAKQATWAANWERHPPFRRLLRIVTAVWGVGFLLDAALRVVLALTLPVDLVPLLDDVLFALTILALLAFQRFYGRAYLLRHGLRLKGVDIVKAEP